MGSIQTGIELQDQFSNVILDFANGMMAATNAAVNFQNAMSQNINTNSLNNVQSEIQSVMDDMEALNQTAQTPISPTVPESVEQTQEFLQRISDIQQNINTQSQSVGVLPDDMAIRVQNVNTRLLQMQEAMNQISQNPFDLPTEAVEAELLSLQSRIRETLQEQLELNETLSNMDVERQNAPPVTIPVHWEVDNFDVFTSSGVDRFRQEVQSANSMLEQLSDTQNEIARQAFRTNILPPDAFQDMNSLAVRIDNVRERIEQIENNPLNL